MRLEPVKFRSIQNQRNQSPTALVFHIKGEMIDKSMWSQRGSILGRSARHRPDGDALANWATRLLQYTNTLQYISKVWLCIVEYETWLMNVTSAEWGRYFNVIRPTVRWETAQDCEQCCLWASQSCCTCKSLGPELCTGFKQPSHWVGTAPRKGRSCLAISWAGERWGTTTTARKIYRQNNWLKKSWIFSYLLFS